MCLELGGLAGQGAIELCKSETEAVGNVLRAEQLMRLGHIKANDLA